MNIQKKHRNTKLIVNINNLDPNYQTMPTLRAFFGGLFCHALYLILIADRTTIALIQAYIPLMLTLRVY